MAPITGAIFYGPVAPPLPPGARAATYKHAPLAATPIRLIVGISDTKMAA